MHHRALIPPVTKQDFEMDVNASSSSLEVDSTTSPQQNRMNERRTQQIVIVPSDTFVEDVSDSPEKPSDSDDTTANSITATLIEIHYGLVAKGTANWIDPKTVIVVYENGKNKAVIAEIPLGREKDYYLAYVMRFALLPRSRGDKIWSENRCLNLQKPEGSFVKLPVINVAPFPWRESQYMIRVRNINNQQFWFSGRIRSIYYGFVESKSDYVKDANVRWMNSFDRYEAEGHIDRVEHRHNNGYKSLLVMYDIWVRVPKGKSVVWKIGFDRWEGSVHTPSIFRGYEETETFLYECVDSEPSEDF